MLVQHCAVRRAQHENMRASESLASAIRNSFIVSIDSSDRQRYIRPPRGDPRPSVSLLGSTGHATERIIHASRASFVATSRPRTWRLHRERTTMIVIILKDDDESDSADHAVQ